MAKEENKQSSNGDVFFSYMQLHLLKVVQKSQKRNYGTKSYAELMIFKANIGRVCPHI